MYAEYRSKEKDKMGYERNKMDLIKVWMSVGLKKKKTLYNISDKCKGHLATYC